MGSTFRIRWNTLIYVLLRAHNAQPNVSIVPGDFDERLGEFDTAETIVAK